LRDLPITMLASAPDMAPVKELFPRTIVLDEGRVVADEPMMKILEDAKLLEAHGLERA
jgi:energy-coupling factor transporter ATP-binding protein EcfA2